MIVYSMAYLQLRWNSRRWVRQLGIMAGMFEVEGRLFDAEEYS